MLVLHLDRRPGTSLGLLESLKSPWFRLHPLLVVLLFLFRWLLLLFVLRDPVLVCGGSVTFLRLETQHRRAETGVSHASSMTVGDGL